MDNDTYTLCKAVVDKINEQKLRIDKLEETIASLTSQIAELSKPKSRSRKKTEPTAEAPQVHEAGLYTTTACSEPIAPSEDADLDVPFDGGSPASDGGDPEPTDYIDTPIKEFPQWDEKEFPVVRGGIELTPDVIAKVYVEFHMGGVDAAYRLKYPTEAIDWILGVGNDTCRKIMAKYQKDTEKKQ